MQQHHSHHHHYALKTRKSRQVFYQPEPPTAAMIKEMQKKRHKHRARQIYDIGQDPPLCITQKCEQHAPLTQTRAELRAQFKSDCGCRLVYLRNHVPYDEIDAKMSNIHLDVSTTTLDVTQKPNKKRRSLSPDNLSPDNPSPDNLSPDNLSPKNLSNREIKYEIVDGDLEALKEAERKQKNLETPKKTNDPDTKETEEWKTRTKTSDSNNSKPPSLSAMSSLSCLPLAVSMQPNPTHAAVVHKKPTTRFVPSSARMMMRKRQRLS